MVSLIIGLSLLKVPANPAVIDESGDILLPLACPLLFRLEHVVASLAEAHSSESCHKVSLQIMEVYNY
jgi:hypothetical protein